MQPKTFAGNFRTAQRIPTPAPYSRPMDTVILCDISAWQYWRTPPVLRDELIPEELACAPVDAGGLGLSRKQLRVRANAREAERLVKPRLLGDLKGLTPPIHVMVAKSSNHVNNSLIICHNLPAWLKREHTAALGNGLSVLTPASALFIHKTKHRIASTAKAMCEACGTYALHKTTSRSDLVLTRLLETNTLSAADSPYQARIREFLDARGKRVPFTDSHGHGIPWQLSFTNTGRPTDLWQRAPLTSVEELYVLASEIGVQRGTAVGLKAMRFAEDGCASPIETQAFLLLCSNARQGGLQVKRPKINMRIDHDSRAQRLAKTAYSIGDFVWPDERAILEVNGEAYHTDRQGFKTASGRTAALQSMGYRVFEINYEQLADFERFNATVLPLLEHLGVTRKLDNHPDSPRAQFHKDILRRDAYSG